MCAMISPEVVEIILSKLDTLSDLLNCRLVSRSWNQEAIFQLRKSKFRKRVNSADLRSCLESIADGGTQFQFILPFHLTHDLRASQRNCTSDADEHDSGCLSKLQAMTEDVTQLYRVCGSDALPDCTLSNPRSYSCDVPTFIAFHKFMRTISARLVKLDLTFGPSDNQTSGAFKEILTILKSSPVVGFPHLKEFVCRTGYGLDYRHYRALRVEAETGSLEYFENVIIENSPNLDTLVLQPTRGRSNYWPRNAPNIFRNLKILEVNYIKNGAELEFLASIRSSRFEPILERFAFSTSECYGDQVSALSDILSCFSKTLKAISVSLKYETWRGASVAGIPVKFPLLPNVEHVGIEFDDVAIPGYMNPEEFDFSPATFPALTSVEMPFGCLLTSPPILPANPGEILGIPTPQTTFPAVSHLTLRVGEATALRVAIICKESWDFRLEFIAWQGLQCADERCEPRCTYPQEISAQAFIALTAEVFPNVTHVTIGKPVDWNSGEDMESVIRAIIESDSALAIETFEIRNYDVDNLRGIVEDETRLVHNKMTNVKKIILKCDKMADYENHSRTDPPQSLMYLSHWFPALEKVEISAVLLGKMKARLGQDFESKLKALLTCDFKLI